MFSLRILLFSFCLLSGLCRATPLNRAEWIHVHPFYVSVFEVRENTKERMLEITCKIFTDDLEKDLRKNYNTHVDLLKDADRSHMGTLVDQYIKAHVQLSVDGKKCVLHYLGFEQDEEAVDCYFEVNDITVKRRVEIVNTILFDYKPEQVNVVHVMAKGTRKSTQLINPERNASFDFP